MDDFGRTGLLLVLLVAVAASVVCAQGFEIRRTSAVGDSDDDKLVKELLEHVLGQQVQKDQKYDFPFAWKKQKGLFETWIHFNSHGNMLQADLRNWLKFFDLNCFVTLFVAQFLIEAYEVNPVLVDVDEKVLLDAVTAVGTYHDHNQQPEKPTMTFWPQLYNETTSYWQQYPENILRPIDEEETIQGAAVKLLEALGLHYLAEKVKEFLPELPMFVSAFVIPPDTDDSAVNWIFGDLLRQNSAVFSSAYSTWAGNNINYTILLQDYVRYAYQPFSSNFDENSIDPRCYYIIRDYLTDQKQRGNLDVMICTTWLTDIDRDRTHYALHEAMPFHVNPIDGNVCANFLLGVTRNLVAALPSPDPAEFSPEVLRLYNSTADFVAWLFDKDILRTIRPDFVLPYYPSTHFFYFSVARSLAVLERHFAACDSTPTRELGNASLALWQAYVRFSETLRGPGTAQLLDMATFEEDFVFWDDFLGDGDVDMEGHPKVRGEDRMFSTALSINALLAIWTVQNGTGLSFLPSVPPGVITAVDLGMSWLRRNVLGKEFPPENAFFSGSAKTGGTNAFFWPMNEAQFLNGTQVDPQAAGAARFLSPELSVPMSGHVDPTEYKEMLARTWFGQLPDLKFAGYNSKDTVFPYWSSHAMTYVTCLLCFVKYQALQA